MYPRVPQQRPDGPPPFVVALWRFRVGAAAQPRPDLQPAEDVVDLRLSPQVVRRHVEDSLHLHVEGTRLEQVQHYINHGQNKYRRRSR